MEQINVNTPTAHYAVVYGRGALKRTGAIIAGLAESTGCAVLSSPRVWRKLGRVVVRSFAECPALGPILFDDREKAKALATVDSIWRKLARLGADRGAVLVAVGGGVVGDLAGFAAACYLRGVRVVHVPTTLVAQIDSAIGGKTGVNLPEGKNLVGAFHHPRLVVVDPAALRTLPERQFRSGLYEVIKYGVIADAQLFSYLENNIDRLPKQDPAALDHVIPRCIRVKADVVSRDEREAGLRRILNFGHTVGHALEAATGYRTLLHGEAVGWGMLAATEIARHRGMLAATVASRIVSLVRRAGRLPPWPRAALEKRFWAALRTDKKARAGKLHFVLPRRIGEVEIVSDVPEVLVGEVLANLPALLRD